ncbi:MAG: hypothetical protein AB7I18_06595 [Candidatus Berkiella sp.]
MQYKGFIIKHYFDVRSGVFIGEVINSAQAIVFTAATLESLKQAMTDAIDSYLDLQIERTNA